MKTHNIFIVASALALMFSSCQQSDMISDDANKPMLFSIVTPGGHTRVADGAFEAQDKVGVYVTDYINDSTPAPLQISGNRANNETMTFDGSAWAAERPIYWGEGKSDVYAYYPYLEVEDINKQPFSVATDQSEEGAYEASDFLWAKTEGVAKSDGAVSLQMKHSMSRLVVKIMAGEEYIGSLPSDATAHLHSTVTDAQLSLANGSVVKDPYGGAHSIKMRNLGIRNFAEGQAVVYEAIVVPQMLETSVPLLEINSKSVSYLLEDMFNFKPGVSYTYTAVLNTSTTSIKVEIGCEIEDWNNIGGSEGEGGSGSEGDDDGIDLSAYTDLSAEGTANCYMISAAGKYKFKAVQGNSDVTVGNVKKTEVLWETFGTDVMPNVGDLVAEVGYKNGYVYFSTPETFANGNASIAVRNSKDVILWSWHIWCTEEGWIDHVYANNAGTMMDRNLGATSATPGDVGALGLLYQWGRKDPFLNSGTLTIKGDPTPYDVAASTADDWLSISGVSFEYAEEYPTTFIGGWYKMVDKLDFETWCDFKKGTYDPCPVGYRVPNGGNNGIWTTSYINHIADNENVGFYWALDNNDSAWYPSAGIGGYGALGYANRVGYLGWGYYWSSSMSTENDSYEGYKYYLSFMGNGFYGSSGGFNFKARTYSDMSCSVRCMKEK